MTRVSVVTAAILVVLSGLLLCAGSRTMAVPHSLLPVGTVAQDMPVVLIESVYYDTYGGGEPDEAVRLVNVSSAVTDISGWRLTDGEGTAVLPPATELGPGNAFWCAKRAADFRRQFGFAPDFEAAESDPAVPNLSGSWPRLANSGDECQLLDAAKRVVDTIVYKGGDTSAAGWVGPAVQPWTPTNAFAADGQILYRKRDQATGLPVTDTNTAADWAQDPQDSVDGRKVLYPGWDLDTFFFTQRVTETAVLTVAVAPDHLFETVRDVLSAAQSSILIEGYSFRSQEIAEILLDRLDDGVAVTLLLEGDPAFEGVTDQEKWILSRLRGHGAQILFMINVSQSGVHDRYRNQHAKFIVVDGERVLIGSENLSYTSMPADNKQNGTAGRRGVYLVTDAPGVVARVQAIWQADADPENHSDVVDCEQVPALCAAPPGFVPLTTPDWMTYTVQFQTPWSSVGSFAFEVIQSPETSLRSRDGLLGLLDRAGAGDTVLVEQLAEDVHWGPGTGTPGTDPNPRVEAYLNAARRGASVRVLLDGYLGGGGDNPTTVAYLRGVARAEGLDVGVRLANPTALGLHNKMVLARIDGRGYVHVGSINGNEASSKLNRELALQVQSNAAFDYLANVFEYDWQSAVPANFLPQLLSGFQGPQRADHLLVSEVYYTSIPEKEWVELYNPAGETIDLSTYKIGDAALPDDYEAMVRFPSGVSLGPGQAVVVAVTATGFRLEFPSLTPDFELWDTDPAVPDMIPYGGWGKGDWGLSNSGDQLLLLDGDDRAVDVIVYGGAGYPGVVAHPGVVAYGHSLQRSPAWLDTDDCSTDFRDWPYPGPGQLP